MMTVIEANIIPLIVALAIGLVIGWWMFRRRRDSGKAEAGTRESRAVEPPRAAAPPPQPRPTARPASDGREGNSLLDQSAAAGTDVAGEMLGVEAHRELHAAGGEPDNLQLLKGVGPKLAGKFNENGIVRFEQLARLSPNEVAILNDKLGPFKGRIERDRLVDQASYLARDDREGFEARFGKLGGAA